MFHDFAHKLLVELTHEELLKQRKENPETVHTVATDTPKQIIGDSFTIQIDDVEITISDHSPGVWLYSHIGEVPQEKQEECFMSMLRGNLLGQATRKASLGIDETGQKVILSRAIETTSNYRDFKDAIEDFSNAACFWKKEIGEKKI